MVKNGQYFGRDFGKLFEVGFGCHVQWWVRDCVGFYKKLLNMFNFYRWRLGSSFVAMVVFFFFTG